VTTSDQHDQGGAGGKLSSTLGGMSNFTLRIVSAIILAPLVLGCVCLGGWVFSVLCAAAAAGVLWEWTRLVVGDADARVLLPGLAALAAALLLAGFGEPGAAAGMIVIGAVLAGGVVAAWPLRFPARNPPLWAAAGVIYAGTAFIGPALLRRDPALGLTAVLFVALSVWGTDIFAYGTGRAIGGPLLWPQVSPNKTWAGAVGGLIGGVVAGTLVAYASGIERLAMLGLIASMLSILTQAGDLFESAVKRRFGAKDTGGLIPGHGGLMDRLDGFLVAALAALLIGVLRQGTDAPAQGLLIW
jgi:phosphatidate cytidylyltransferase